MGMRCSGLLHGWGPRFTGVVLPSNEAHPARRSVGANEVGVGYQLGNARDLDA